LVHNNIFKANPVKICDVGVRGGFAQYWRLYKDQVELTGFEADQEECNFLTEYFKLSQWKTKFYPHALHRDCARRTFYITEKPGSSGFYPANGMFRRLWSDDDTKVIKTIEMDTVNLDSFGLNFDFIKLDTEGCELDVLMGAEETLRNVIGLSVETEFTPLHIGQPLFRDVDLFISSHGFKLFDLTSYLFGRKTMMPPESVDESRWGQAIVGQALYLRDGYEILDSTPWDPIKVLKLASFMDIFNLNDCAIELINKACAKGILAKNTAARLNNLLLPDYLEGEKDDSNTQADGALSNQSRKPA